MNDPVSSSNEQQVVKAFNRQAVVFDDIYSPNLIIQYKRDRVRKEVEKYLPANANILELNAGTGDDAIYFAQHGHHVHATDISTGMQDELKKKVELLLPVDHISTEICSFTQLEMLQNTGPYDLIFSNFAGLNCTPELDNVLESFSPLLKQCALVTLVLMPPFCLWETLLAFRGKFKIAFRRFNSKQGVPAQIEGVHFTCWYYKPSFVVDQMKSEFDVVNIEGLCTLVPPSYFENFPKKYPGNFAWLKKQENKLKNKWPWKNMGDYFIITMRKR